MRCLGSALVAVLSLLVGITAVLGSATVAGARLDETPPVVELVGPADGAVVVAADLSEVTCTATDDVRLRGTCTVEFIEQRGDSGIDVSLTATAIDRRDNSASVTSDFTLLFDAVAPTTADDRSIGLLDAGPITIDVLANDHDADGDLEASSLRITSNPDVGAASVDTENAVVIYEPAAVGGASLNYEVCDAVGACASATVEVMVLGESDCTIFGTDGDDDLVGTHGDDVVCGLGGNDQIRSLGGNDIVFAGPGDDVVIGGGGGDALFGGAGADQLRGGAGDDFLDGGTGDDLMKGENHDDVVFGNVGDDELHGGLGDDLVSGGSGDDIAYGWAGDDLVTGGLGDDIVRGGTDDDELHGSSGDDFLHGEGGDDVLVGGDGYDSGDAGKETDACASVELRLRCESYGVNADRVVLGGSVLELPELPPAEHDAEDELVVPQADIIGAEDEPAAENDAEDEVDGGLGQVEPAEVVDLADEPESDDGELLEA